jgi:hypothetical protein
LINKIAIQSSITADSFLVNFTVKNGLLFFGGIAMNNLQPRVSMPVPNEGKGLLIDVGGSCYARYPITTQKIAAQDDIASIVIRYTQGLLQEGDILFLSEKALACSQGRAIPLSDVNPGWLAGFLSRYVCKSPYGVGLALPETMEMAIRECGAPRILFAAFISALGKMIGRRGWFYRVAGQRASSIDGPWPGTLPPYNNCIVLCPREPMKVAKEISNIIGVAVCVVDINDLGGNILGHSSLEASQRKAILAALRDNPLGQGAAQTPLGILRRIRTDVDQMPFIC